MSNRSIWAILGVASDADRAEIRRAYAARLKQTNPEDDADGFQALRQAYESALSMADYRERIAAARAARAEAGEPEEDDDEDDEFDLMLEGAEIRPSRDEPAGPPSEESLERQARARVMQAHGETCDRLGELVFERAPAEAQMEAFEAVMASPPMASISVHGDTERWLASTLLHGGPQSAPVIEAAAERFGWNARAGDWNLPHDVALLMARNRDTALIMALERSKGPTRDAYRALMRSPKQLSPLARLSLQRHRSGVRALLAQVRRDHPEVLDHFDPEAVAWWDRQLPKRSSAKGGGGGTAAWVWVFRAIIALSVLSSCLRDYSPDPAPTTQSSAIETRLETLRQRAVSHPEDAANLVELCRERARTGQDLDSGPYDCAAAVSGGQQPVTALDSKAMIELRLERAQDAKQDYDALLKLSPNSARAFYGRGLARRQTEDPRADADLQHALLIDPGVARTFLGYGLPVPSIAPVDDRRKQAMTPQPNPPPISIRIRRGAAVVRPDMVSKPDQAAFDRLYPKAALRDGTSGHVLIRCGVQLSGRLADCLVWRETPEGQGFADAALQLARGFRFTPLSIDGRPDPRGVVTLPIGFRVAGKPASAQASAKPGWGAGSKLDQAVDRFIKAQR